MEITKSISNIGVDKISLAVHNNDSIYLFNPDLSRCYRIPAHSQDIYLSNKVCSIVGISIDSHKPALKVTTRDYYDNLLGESDYHFPETRASDHIFDFSPSPDQKWLAYKQGSDDTFRSYFESDQTTVKLVRLDGSQFLKVMDLSEGNGAHHTNLAWSPDGRYLAFSDFDNNGVTQIYLYDPETGRKRQLSNFVDGKKEYGITNLTWTEDSSQLLYIKGKYWASGTFLYETYGGGIGVLSTMDDQDRWIVPFAEDLDIQSINVNNKGELLTLSRKSGQSHKFAITVYNLNSGGIIKTISPSILSNINDIVFVIPLDPDFSRFVIDFGPTFVYNDKNKSQIVITSYPFFYQFKIITTTTGSIIPPTCGL